MEITEEQIEMLREYIEELDVYLMDEDPAGILYELGDLIEDNIQDNEGDLDDVGEELQALWDQIYDQNFYSPGEKL